MSLPTPPSPLEGHCSVVYNNTLYVYTPNAFMSLPLELHGNWSTLAMGESVSGAACVKGGVDGDNTQTALYVVGGVANSSAYPGLQRYLFAQDQWETITPGSKVTEHRLYHGAAYLTSSSSILVYGGSQDGSTIASTSTFSISTVPPYDVASYPAQGAPAAVSPSLLPWDDATAVYVGGSPFNTEVFLFSISSGWRTSGVSLIQAIPSNAGVAIVSGTDGSKILQTFDMSVSPNMVNSTAMLDANGAPAYPGQQVGAGGSSSSPTRKRKRTTMADFPSYNGTYAPTATRSDFAVAQSDNGMIVITGGSDTDPLCMFDQSHNGWVNTNQLFNGNEEAQQPLIPVTSSPTTAAPAATSSTSSLSQTSSASATPTLAPSSGSSSTSTGTIIGATLGALVGIAALLVLILLFLRRQRQKNVPRGSPSRGFASDDKDRLSFQDQGIEPLTRSAYPMATGPVISVDSLAIMSGNEKMMSATPILGYGRPSPLPTIAPSPADGVRSAAAARSPSSSPPRGDRRTDEGWSKYFQDNSATNLAGMQSARTTMTSDVSDDSRSDYRNSAWPQLPPIRPLDLGDLEEPRSLSRVPTGSPSTEHLAAFGRGSVIHQGQAAKISSADSISLVSDEDEHDRADAFSSGIPASINDMPWAGRPPSSTYSSSYYPDSSRRETAYTQQGGQRGSSTLFHDQFPPPPSHSNVNSDMSWLNLHADR